ncbi:11777_t:CDS:2 [Ambispora gerdemannii]|uniref:11777_t:CDS:1 n=1 Tax=Ambispora gerdemannii TaxID=144530 RepID=A0A9N8ZUD6_9GLOM|nr:11777_t:CDS:2 [Ambispora gerdemannii]
MTRLVKLGILLVLVLLIAGEVLGKTHKHATRKSKTKNHKHIKHPKNIKPPKKPSIIKSIKVAPTPKVSPTPSPSPSPKVVAPPQKGIPQPTSTKSSSIVAKTPQPASNGKNICRSYSQNFSEARIVEHTDYQNDPKTADWINLSGTKGTYSLDGGNLNMILQPPSSYEKITTQYHPYNSKLGTGLTLNSTYMIHYGKVSAKIKSSSLGGVVTAYITMSPNGDEIDWELVGNDTLHAQSNWYWNGVIEWGVHGGMHNVTAPGISDEFKTYTIDWTPEAITWLINGSPVRTLKQSDTLVDGVPHFPNHPSYIQLGIWDGSGAPGTAEWANGPIDWSQQKTNPRTLVSEIEIECDPTWNQVIN